MRRTIATASLAAVIACGVDDPIEGGGDASGEGTGTTSATDDGTSGADATLGQTSAQTDSATGDTTTATSAATDSATTTRGDTMGLDDTGGTGPGDTSIGDTTNGGSTDDGSTDGGSTDDGSTGGQTTGNEECGTLPVTLRDFQQAHPDFENVIVTDPGIVESTLGMDEKPVYASMTATPSTTGQANFDQWYNDVMGVNIVIPDEIVLQDQGMGVYVFDDDMFFPVDGQGFGNEGNAHNYHFTLELHTGFVYEGGELFTFRGDDDLFVFVNGILALDLGGVHPPIEDTIDFDAQAANLGITPGNVYAIDLFFAERHTSQSNFRIETTIACFEPQ